MDVTSWKRTALTINILAIKISFAFEFNSTNSSSADTNLDNYRFYQKF